MNKTFPYNSKIPVLMRLSAGFWSVICYVSPQGLPVFAIGVGLSALDKATVSIRVQFIFYRNNFGPSCEFRCHKQQPRLLKICISKTCEKLRSLLSLLTGVLISSQVNDYVQSHIQINEYRDRVILVSYWILGFNRSFSLHPSLSLQ